MKKTILITVATLITAALSATAMAANTAAADAPVAATAAVKDQKVVLTVTEKGFEPASVDVKPGIPVVLEITRKTESTCATNIHIPSKKIKQDLPMNKTVSIKVGKLEKGEIRFACGMDMISGIIHVR